jgi:hypothetical protein
MVVADKETLRIAEPGWLNRVRMRRSGAVVDGVKAGAA